jgi:predicted nucleic acid-binding protein
VIVVDASVVVQFLIKSAVSPHVVSLIAGEDVLAAPALLDYEAISALRRLTLAGEISDVGAQSALANLADLRIDRYEIEPLIDRIWSLRRSLTVYDASYVALAEQLDLPLHTTDSKLAKSRGHRARIVAM